LRARFGTQYRDSASVVSSCGVVEFPSLNGKH